MTYEKERSGLSKIKKDIIDNEDLTMAEFLKGAPPDQPGRDIHRLRLLQCGGI